MITIEDGACHVHCTVTGDILVGKHGRLHIHRTGIVQGDVTVNKYGKCEIDGIIKGKVISNDGGIVNRGIPSSSSGLNDTMDSVRSA
jgi:hypothetical protein